MFVKSFISDVEATTKAIGGFVGFLLGLLAAAYILADEPIEYEFLEEVDNVEIPKAKTNETTD